MRGLGAVAGWKERTFAALDPRPGAVLLDVGCGTGEDVLALGEPGPAGRPGDRGRRQRGDDRRGPPPCAAAAGDAPVEFRRADAAALGLPDDSVDGARVERVLQHLDDPAAAVAEMARAVRPGGRVVAAEPDWGSLVIDAGDPASAAQVAAAAAGRLRSALVGRRLRRIMLDAGLDEVEVAARTLLITDAEQAIAVFDLPDAAARAVAGGGLPEAQAAEWLEALARDGAEGRVLVAMTAFMAAGRVGPPTR